MRCGWAKRTSSPIAGPGKVHGPVPPTINGPNRLICLVQSVPNVEPAPPSCCRLATAKPCSSISTRSQPKSPSERTPLSSLIRPAGMAPRPSRFQTTSRSCSFRRAHPNSTARKTSGSSCVRIGCQTGFSNPSTISSTTAATLGTHSLTNPGRLCPSRDVTGQQSVTQSENWYYTPIRPQMGANQQVQATVKVRGAYGRACCKEVELLIRMTITRNSITGYELNCSVVPAGPYLTLVRWNGPLNNFTYLVRNATTCVNSDVLAETLARPPFRG